MSAVDAMLFTELPGSESASENTSNDPRVILAGGELPNPEIVSVEAAVQDNVRQGDVGEAEVDGTRVPIEELADPPLLGEEAYPMKRCSPHEERAEAMAGKRRMAARFSSATEFGGLIEVDSMTEHHVQIRTGRQRC